MQLVSCGFIFRVKIIEQITVKTSASTLHVAFIHFLDGAYGFQAFQNPVCRHVVWKFKRCL